MSRVVCPECAERIEPGHRYCPYCGASLTGRPPAGVISVRYGTPKILSAGKRELTLTRSLLYVGCAIAMITGVGMIMTTLGGGPDSLQLGLAGFGVLGCALGVLIALGISGRSNSRHPVRNVMVGAVLGVAGGLVTAVALVVLAIGAVLIFLLIACSGGFK